MRKLIVIIILLIIPIALKAQVSAEERQVEYQLSVAPSIAFKMPYHVARPDIMGHYDRALGFVVDFDVRTNVNKYLYAGGNKRADMESAPTVEQMVTTIHGRGRRPRRPVYKRFNQINRKIKKPPHKPFIFKRFGEGV